MRKSKSRAMLTAGRKHWRSVPEPPLRLSRGLSLCDVTRKATGEDSLLEDNSIQTQSHLSRSFGTATTPEVRHWYLHNAAGTNFWHLALLIILV